MGNSRHPEVNAILLKVPSLLDPTRRFPQKIFLGTWKSYSFFDSDWIFSPEFVPWVKSLLQAEGGTRACIYDLDAMAMGHSPQPLSFVIDKETCGGDYQLFLGGSSTDTGWLYTVDRFACTSDKGDWCIYCERRNEIAVIALRSDRIRRLLPEVKAMPIEQALALPLSYGFSARALSPAWRKELLKEYNND